MFRMIKVLLNDNEENAELALKFITELQRYYRSTYDVMVSHSPSFMMV